MTSIAEGKCGPPLLLYLALLGGVPDQQLGVHYANMRHHNGLTCESISQTTDK